MKLYDFFITIGKTLKGVAWSTQCVCLPCLRADDVRMGQAGDFSVCVRCRASITSKTGACIRVDRS